MSVTDMDPDEAVYGPFRVTDGGDLMLGGLGCSLDAVLAAAAQKGKRTNIGEDVGTTVYVLIYELRAAVIALRRKIPTAEAARVMQEVVEKDPELLAAVDAAYKLGGAKAVRDLMLRACLPPNSP